MIMVELRMKEQLPLQKPWVSPRFRMARSGQGRQRLKALLLLDSVREEPPFPSAKIRSRWMSHQIFGATTLRFPIISIIRSRAIVANMILAWLPSELVRGFSILASSSLPSLAPPGCLRFFFSSITGTTQTCLVVVRAELKGLSSPCIFYVINFLFSISFWFQGCLSSFMYIVPSLYLIKDDLIAFYVSFLFCNNYRVNGCTGVFSLESYLEPMTSMVELFIEIDEHNSADFE